MNIRTILAAGAGGTAYLLLKLVLAVLQLVAMIVGVQVLFNVHWIIAVLLWLLTVTLPVVPTILGIFGAIEGWGWTWWQAGLLFFGLEIATTVLAISLGISLLGMFRRKAKRT